MLPMTLEEFLTEKNAKGYALSKDRLVYCSDITGLPLRSKMLEHYEHEMWIFACELQFCTETN